MKNERKIGYIEALRYIRSKGVIITDEEFEKLYMEGGGPPFQLESPMLTSIKDEISWLEETLEDAKHDLFVYENKSRSA